MFLHEWKDSGLFGLISDFEDIYITKAEYEAETSPHKNEAYWLEKKQKMTAALAKERYQGLEVLLASYECAGYEGDAFVLFRKDGALYEVNGSHCSCYGLEGQWEPEETTPQALWHRLDKGDLGGSSYSGNVYAAELRAVLSTIEAAA